MAMTNFSRGDTSYSGVPATAPDTPRGFSQLSSQDDVHRPVFHAWRRHEHRWHQHWNLQISMPPPPTSTVAGLEEKYERKHSPQGPLQSYPSHTPSSSSDSASPGFPAPNAQNPDPRHLSTRVGPPVLGVNLTIAEAESRLRHVHNLPAGVPLTLTAIPDPPPPQVHQDTLVQIAIWSSPFKRLTAADIYAAIQTRFRSFPGGPDQPWRRSIRHMLSFKRAFVKSADRNHAGRHFWELDFDHLDQGYKRERKRGKVTKNQRGKGGEPLDEELGLDEILVNQEGLYLKEEYHTPSPLSFYHEPLPSEDISSTVLVSADRSGRTRHSHPHSHSSSHTLRRPASRQRSSASPALRVSGPVYLYPPGGYPDLKEAILPMLTPITRWH